MSEQAKEALTEMCVLVLQYCPTLQHLTLCDLSAQYGDENERVMDALNCADVIELRSLTLNSVIKDYPMVADSLCGMFPRLSNLETLALKDLSD